MLTISRKVMIRRRNPSGGSGSFSYMYWYKQTSLMSPRLRQMKLLHLLYYTNEPLKFDNRSGHNHRCVILSQRRCGLLVSIFGSSKRHGGVSLASMSIFRLMVLWNRRQKAKATQSICVMLGVKNNMQWNL